MATFYLPSSGRWSTGNDYTTFRVKVEESYSGGSKNLKLSLLVTKSSNSSSNSVATCKVTWYLNNSSQGTTNLGSTTIKPGNSDRVLTTKTITLANSATSATIKVKFDMSGCSIGTNTKSGTVTLTKYALTYKNGSTTVATTNACYKNTVTLNSGSSLSKDGYRFLGWSTSSTATSASYSGGASYTMPASAVTLYAIWSANDYIITYSANGGTGQPSPQEKVGGTDIVLSSEIPIREGYTFQGWATTDSSNTVEYNPGDIYSINSDLNLYAVWQANQYTLTLNPNYPNSETTKLTLTFGTTNYYGINVYTPTRIGYKFLGWFTDSSTGVQIYDENGLVINEGVYWENDIYSYPGDLTVYAHWESLNLAHIKIDGKYYLANTHVKVDGQWYPAIYHRKIEEIYERSVVY